MNQLLLLFLFLMQPSRAADPLEEARAALSRGDLTIAEREVSAVLEENHYSAEAHFILGGIRSRQHRFVEAEDHLLKTLELDSGFAEAYSVLGTLFQSQNRGEEATTVLERGVQHIPENAELRFLLARQYSARQDFDLALTQLKEIPENKQPVEYFDLLGQCYLLSGKLEEAKSAYQNYLSEHPDSVRTLRTLAAINLRAGDPSTAWDLIAQARRLAPNSTQVLYDFAEISMIENLIGEAATALQYLLLMEPENPDALFKLGSAFIHFANFGRSQEIFSQYTTLRPEDAQGHAMLGYSLYLGNKFAEARPHLVRALQLDPGLTDAIFYLGMVAYSTGDDEEAERRFQEVIEVPEGHGRAHLTLGKLYFRQRKLQKAKEELEKAVQLIPADYEVHFQLSRVYATTGDRDRAAEELNLYKKYKGEEDEREKEARRTPYSNFGRTSDNKTTELTTPSHPK